MVENYGHDSHRNTTPQLLRSLIKFELVNMYCTCVNYVELNFLSGRGNNTKEKIVYRKSMSLLGRQISIYKNCVTSLTFLKFIDT